MPAPTPSPDPPHAASVIIGMSTLRTIKLDCGLTLVTETIPNVASAAVSWLLPLGSSSDPTDCDGQAALLSELIFRGAGGLNSREHSDSLDRLGVQRDSNVGVHHLRLGATLLGAKLEAAMPLLVSMVTRPALPAEALDAVKSLSIQSLEALDDEPQHLVMLKLGEMHVPPPFNRHGHGERSVLENATIEELRAAWSRRCVPSGTILAAAGAVDPDLVAGQLNELLTGWQGEYREPEETSEPARGRHHIAHETSQTHIAVGYNAPPEPHEHSMLERMATSVLSGGTSGRLFTEVRQKRSLCYSVGASYRGGRDRGLVALYAGTTPERAGETLDVCLAEIERMKRGANQEEFNRAVTGLKSHLVMSGESTAARASAIGHDYHCLGRARSLDEIAAQVDRITLDQLNAYLAERDFGEFTVVTIGPGAAETSKPQTVETSKV